MPADSVSGEGYFLVHRWSSPCCVVTRQGAKELSGVSFIRALIALMGAHPPDLITSRRPCFLAPSHWVLGFNMWILQWGQTQAFRA